MKCYFHSRSFSLFSPHSALSIFLMAPFFKNTVEMRIIIIIIILLCMKEFVRLFYWICVYFSVIVFTVWWKKSMLVYVHIRKLLHFHWKRNVSCWQLNVVMLQVVGGNKIYLFQIFFSHNCYIQMYLFFSMNYSCVIQKINNI